MRLRWGRTLWITWTQAQEHELPLVASSLAFYAFFSIFPILLFFMLALSSYVSTDPQGLLGFIQRYLPGREAAGLVQEVLLQAAERREAAGVVALVMLWWSGSGVFSLIARAVNRAWRDSRPRPFWQARLLGLILALGVGGLFFASLASTTVINAAQALPGFRRLPGWTAAHYLVPLSLNFLMFLVLYTGLPNLRVRVRWVAPAALFSAVGWEVAKLAFAFYLRNFSRYSVIYGSVGAVIILLLWAYISAYILLLGAELGEAYARVFHGLGEPERAHPDDAGGGSHADA